jgi:hypothetical protein
VVGRIGRRPVDPFVHFGLTGKDVPTGTVEIGTYLEALDDAHPAPLVQLRADLVALLPEARLSPCPPCAAASPGDLATAVALGRLLHPTR